MPQKLKNAKLKHKLNLAYHKGAKQLLLRKKKKEQEIVLFGTQINEIIRD